jgi:hypothetical protein
MPTNRAFRIIKESTEKLRILICDRVKNAADTRIMGPIENILPENGMVGCEDRRYREFRRRDCWLA